MGEPTHPPPPYDMTDKPLRNQPFTTQVQMVQPLNGVDAMSKALTGLAVRNETDETVTTVIGDQRLTDQLNVDQPVTDRVSTHVSESQPLLIAPVTAQPVLSHHFQAPEPVPITTQPLGSLLTEDVLLVAPTDQDIEAQKGRRQRAECANCCGDFCCDCCIDTFDGMLSFCFHYDLRRGHTAHLQAETGDTAEQTGCCGPQECDCGCNDWCNGQDCKCECECCCCDCNNCDWSVYDCTNCDCGNCCEACLAACCDANCLD